MEIHLEGTDVTASARLRRATVATEESLRRAAATRSVESQPPTVFLFWHLVSSPTGFIRSFAEMARFSRHSTERLSRSATKATASLGMGAVTSARSRQGTSARSAQRRV